jgi:K+-sensing histidine kinase KdpD
MTVIQFPELCSRLPATPTDVSACLRALVPLKRESDIFKVLPYLQSLAIKVSVEILFLHVTPARAVKHDPLVDRLLASAAAACLQHDLTQQSVVADGDVAFTILDSAESFRCDQIVIARPVASAWRNLFSTPVVRQLESRGRDVPLVLVNFAGTVQEMSR